MRLKTPTKSLSVLTLVIALLLSSCGEDSDESLNVTNDSSAEADVVIGYVGDLSGGLSSLDAHPANGAKLAIDQAVKRNPKLKIEFRLFDTKNDNNFALQQAQEYVKDPKLVAIIGPAASGTTRAVLPTYQQNGLVMISATATNATLPSLVPEHSVFHRVRPDDLAQSRSLSDYMTTRLGTKRVAYVYNDSDYGKALAQGVRDELVKAGVTTALEAEVPESSNDFSNAIQQIKDTQADAVFYGGYPIGAGNLRKQMVDAGLKAAFLTGDGALDDAFIESAQDATSGAYVTCGCRWVTTNTPGAAGEFAKQYVEAFKLESGNGSPEAYDIANLLIKGLEAGATDRASLLDFVNATGPYEGISGTIEFAANGNPRSEKISIFGVRGNQFTFIEDSTVTGGA